jgi:hypothetical protein
LMHIVYNSWLHDAVICSYSDELGMMILAWRGWDVFNFHYVGFHFRFDSFNGWFLGWVFENTWKIHEQKTC